MKDDYSKSYLDYLKILIIIVLLMRNVFMLTILFFLRKLRQAVKLLNLKVVIEEGFRSTKIFLAKVKSKTGQDKTL